MRKRGPFWSSFLVQKMHKMALCKLVNGVSKTDCLACENWNKMEIMREMSDSAQVQPVDNLVESVNNFLAKGKK